MFSGIITDTAEIVGREILPEGLKLTFRRPSQWNDLELGESVATNGVCLTVDGMTEDTYTATLIPQTLATTTFGQMVPEWVNLERSLRLGDRISGHFVQGHVDDIGSVVDIDSVDGYRLWISYPPVKRALIVEKGSIVINGVALTVAEVSADKFCVALVPFTLDNTTLGTLSQGDLVNLEYDVLGKYIVNAVEANKI